MQKPWLIFLAFLAVAFPAMANDKVRYFVAEYRLYVSGLLIGKAIVRLSVSSEDYVLSAHMRPAGFGRIAGQSHVVSTTRGALRDGNLMPQRLDLSWTSDDTIKSSYMDYVDGAPHKFVSGYAQPEEFRSKNPIAIENVGVGSVDPFLGLLSPLNGRPLRAACDGTKRIFDGRRLATLTAQDVVFVPPFEHDFPQRRPAVKCSILWQPVAGYSEASLERAAEFPPVSAHFGQIGNIGFAAPLDMRGKSRYGRVTIYAVRYFTETMTPFSPFDIREITAQ
ncbi:MAG: hypothetical protein ACPG2A_02820 [Parvibaculales bacterium]